MVPKANSLFNLTNFGNKDSYRKHEIHTVEEMENEESENEKEEEKKENEKEKEKKENN